MTPIQRKLYFVKWKKAKEGMRSYGRDVSDDRAARMECHAAAGIPLSSTSLSNSDLDKVLAVFWSWSQPSNMDAQMRQQTQPAVRCRFLCKHVMERTNEVVHVFLPTSFDAYIDALWRKLNKADLEDPEYGDEASWQKVIIALHYRYSQVVGQVLGPRKRRPSSVQVMDYPPIHHTRHMAAVRQAASQPF